jgi:hypothetical protein
LLAESAVSSLQISICHRLAYSQEAGDGGSFAKIVVAS